MENLYDKILLMKKHKILAEQLLVENNITIEGGDEVEKILSIDTNVDLDNSIETFVGECNLGGKVITNIVFVTADGELNSQTSVAPFSYKLKNENIHVNSRVNASAYVVNTEMDKLLNNQLKIVNTVNIDSVVIENQEKDYLKDGGENCYIKQEGKDVVSFKRGYCEKFEEKLETSVKMGVKKVLTTNVDCILKEWTIGPKFVSIECELYAKVLYADKQEVSELQTVTIAKNVRQEIEIEVIDKNCDIDLIANIIYENVIVEVGENEKDTTICVNIPVMVCYNQYECTNVLTVSDIYSTHDILSVQSDEGNVCRNLKPEYLEEKIEGNVVLSDDQPRIDKYLAVTNLKTSPINSYIKNGTLYIEGIASANVMYLNDELGALQSVEIEIPFVMDKNVAVEGDVILEPSLCLCDVDVMVKKGREIFFDAKVKAFVNITCNDSISFVSKVENLGTVQNKDGAIEIYFGKAGETLWDISKSLKVSGDIIKNQNPDISDPLDKDQNIALYYQKIK